MSACSVSGTRKRSVVALSGLSVVVEAGRTMVTMAPETVPVVVNVTVAPDYIEPVRLVQFNPALAAVCITVVVCFFSVVFVAGCLKKCIRPAEADPEDEIVRPGGSPGSKSGCGLDPKVLATLPRIEYKDLSLGDKDLDCPVCLAAFDANDKLRLLPQCSHVFHTDCIDAWFLSHSTCPLCRACLLPMDEAQREGDAADGEQVEIRVDVVVEVMIGGDAEQDRSRRVAVSEFLQEGTGGAPVAKFSTVEDKKQGIAHRSAATEAFKPAVRVEIVPAKAAAVASIRRSNSDLQLPHPCYVVDSEGTQHNRNRQAHIIDVEEFLLKDQNLVPNSCESSSEQSQPASRYGPQLVQSASLRHSTPAESSER